jgi:hypothetical protein
VLALSLKMDGRRKQENVFSIECILYRTDALSLKTDGRRKQEILYRMCSVI